MKDFIRINERDNVVVALKELPAGREFDIKGKNASEIKVTAAANIPAGHKMAIHTIKKGEDVVKYGFRIGTAKEEIKAGQWVHVHNIKTSLGDLLDYDYQPISADIPILDDVKFMGYVRSDGSVGVRNEIWVIPTVGCVNSVAAALANAANKRAENSVDAVVAFPHPYGCSQMGDDQEHTRTILADLIRHPNAGGVLVLGLGCENSNIGELKKYLGDYDEKRIRFLVCQESEDEMADGAAILDELITLVKSDRRKPVSASKLTVGMKCGGSDGFSGITANPLVGKFSDLLIARGGTTILTEVPEMFGAETLLMNRCQNRELFEKTVKLVNDFKQYFKENNQTIYENPSPGNKSGGISTLEDKSLGCTQKSGGSLVRGVLMYGEQVTAHGLNLLSAPGNDLVASTALAASGAQIVLFTTGRGTPFASPVPTVKIASNSALAGKKKKWIDFDAGTLAEDASLDEMGQKLFTYVIEVASGKKVCSEEAGFHDMAIFKQGVTL